MQSDFHPSLLLLLLAVDADVADGGGKTEMYKCLLASTQFSKAARQQRTQH